MTTTGNIRIILVTLMSLTSTSLDYILHFCNFAFTFFMILRQDGAQRPRWSTSAASTWRIQ